MAQIGTVRGAIASGMLLSISVSWTRVLVFASTATIISSVGMCSLHDIVGPRWGRRVRRRSRTESRCALDKPDADLQQELPRQALARWPMFVIVLCVLIVFLFFGLGRSTTGLVGRKTHTFEVIFNHLAQLLLDRGPKLATQGDLLHPFTSMI